MERVPDEKALSESPPEAKEPVRGHLILAEVVIDALSKCEEGMMTDYDAVVEHLSVGQMKAVVMQRWLQGLSLCVSKFTKKHGKLVEASLKFLWYDKDPTTVDMYVDYLTTLLSVHPHHLNIILSNLTQQLWVEHGGGEEEIMKNVHMAIQAVLAHAPLGTSVLLQLLTKGYPYKGKAVQIQELALRNVLFISLYCPSLREDILDLVVHQMVTIDVELPNLEEEGEEGADGEGSDTEAGSDDTQFHVELDSEGDVVKRGSAAATGVSEEVQLGVHYSSKPVMQHEQAEKLDMMMSVCLHYFHGLCHCEGSLDEDEAWVLLQSLLKTFERVVLPTHACSHVQFLLFQLTSLHQDFSGYFLEFLWQKFQDPNVPSTLRQTTVAYIASYVARSKFVSLETARLCISIMMDWIHKYLDDTAPENLKPDAKVHGPFYSLCQAAFYIFVFRNKSFSEMEGGMDFLLRLNFERVITSRLNPLKVCLPSVVEQFAPLANKLEVAFSYTILERNKRLVFSTLGNTHHNPLDSFFPFDPYHLKRSGKFINSLYQHWEGSEDGGLEEDQEADQADCSSLASSMSYNESRSLPEQSM